MPVRHKRSIVSALLALCLALALFVQGSATTLLARGVDHADQATQTGQATQKGHVQANADVGCAKGAARGVPAPGRHSDGAACVICALCASPDLKNWGLSPVSLAGAVSILPPPAGEGRLLLLEDVRFSLGLGGWASTWTAQGPPLA